MAIVNHLYDQGGRREEPTSEVVCRLAGASAAVCDEVIRKWRGRLASATSEAGVMPTSEWVRKLSELTANKAIVDDSLAAAVAASQAQTSATNQCVTEIIAGFAVQAEELRHAIAKAADLEGRRAIAVEAAAVAERKAAETNSQLEMMTKEVARVIAENDEIKRLADELKAGLASAGASAQRLFAKIDSGRAEQVISSARRNEMATSEPARSDQLQISNVDLAAAVTATLQNEIQGRGDPTESIAMATTQSTIRCNHGYTRGTCQDCASQDKPKTREDVERLMHEWNGDGEIEHTNGFGAHYAELLAFSIERKAFWAERQAAAEARAQKRLEEYAAEVGTPGNTALAQVLNRFMAETKALERENGELIDRMNRVEARLDRLNCVLPVGVLDSRSGDPDG
jgi:hypothetical protein